MLKKTLLIATATLALYGCGEQSQTSTGQTAAPVTAAKIDKVSETERLNAWFAERWEESLSFSPIFKSFLGRADDKGKIDDYSEAGAAAQLQWQRDAATALKENFDYENLTDDGKISYDVWMFQLAQAEAAEPFSRRGYVFHQMSGPHAFLPNFLINFHSVQTQQDMDDYVSRISGVARAIEQSTERARLAAAEGVHAPKFAYEAVIAQSRAIITGAPFDDGDPSPLWSDIDKKVAGLVSAQTISEDEGAALKEQASQALTTTLQPAYEALIAWVESDIENSPAVATGVHILPDGEAFYKERLQFSTTTSMTPDEVHELGLSEVARIRAEMVEIKDAVGFEGPLQEFFTFVREDDQFYYPNTDEGREQYLQAARDSLEEINKKLPEYFGLLPKADLIVKRVEAFRERDGGAQHYFPGTPDGSRPGIFYAHLSDMKAMPIPQLEVIAYHEGNPGHHMQNSIAQEVEGLPEFRNQASFTAYGEGWALYSELLAKEMGAYEDPYSDFGRLTTEIWRAIRLVVDTGLHHKGWTEDEAVAYFTANSPAASGQIRSEIQRYIVLPGQATSYKVGMLTILELREKARAELGDEFDIREFHDVVLGGGALPLEILSRRIDTYIAEKKAA